MPANICFPNVYFIYGPINVFLTSVCVVYVYYFQGLSYVRNREYCI
jgi:AAA+ ATPase superfamily predicted ATPase